jgi:holo-[acyl-carrier protein] synthase
MRIIGHGIDAVKIADIKAEVDSRNKRWAEQFCSAEERALAGVTAGRYRYYASCFAAKEAVAKALGTGFAGDITWRGIEILRRESGAPYIRLRDEVLALAEGMGITSWFISISYLDEVALASVIAVRDEIWPSGAARHSDENTRRADG